MRTLPDAIGMARQVRSGHYVALARAPGGGWDELDDRRGAPAARTPQEVERGSADTAVLLFYARQPPPPPGWTSRGRVYHLDARHYILCGKIPMIYNGDL